jgi:hypothetical protein
LSEPWLPTGSPSSVGHPVASPTVPTRAPGAVRHLTTAALLAHCLVVFYLTVPGHCLHRQAPTATSGEKHPPSHLHTRQSWCLTLRTPLRERFVACRASPEPMHLQSERPPWYTLDQVIPSRAGVQTVRRLVFDVRANSRIRPTIHMLWSLRSTQSCQENFHDWKPLTALLSRKLQKAVNQRILLQCSFHANSDQTVCCVTCNGFVRHLYLPRVIS